jgi:hypothetical protein
MRWLLLVALLAHIAAHIGTIAILWRRTELKWRALFACALPPLAPFWAWDKREYRSLWAWLGTFVLYAALLGFR